MIGHHGLPEYAILSAAATASLNIISSFSHDAYQGEGTLRLSFNASMTPWQEMDKKSTLLLPATALPEGINLTLGFLDNSMVQLWQLRSKPTSTTTYAMLVGLAGHRHQLQGALAIGSRIGVPTPPYFLLAMEDLENVALQHAAAWSASERKRLEEACDDSIESEHVEKRIRLGVQDDLGVHSQGLSGLTAEGKAVLGDFLRKSVTTGTAKIYDGQWHGWCEFIDNIEWGKDPYMREEREDNKAALVALYLQSRYDKGARGKSATSVTAGLRHSFITALLPCQFLDSPIIVAARTGYRLSTTELREKRNEGASTRVKLPLYESILIRTRRRLWVSFGWDRGGVDQKMIYLAAMWAYNIDARVSEYTAPERGGEDHCVRMGDLDFEMVCGERKKGGRCCLGQSP